MKWIVFAVLLIALVGSSTATTVTGGKLSREVELPPKCVRIYLYPDEEIWIDGCDVTAVHLYPVYKPTKFDEYGAAIDKKELDRYEVVVHGPNICLKFYNKYGAIDARDTILNSMGYRAPSIDEDSLR